MMSILLLVLGGVLLALGLAALVEPRFLRAALERFLARDALYVASGVRVLAGLVLIVGAHTTRAPIFVALFGLGLASAGMTIPLMGEERIERFSVWWLTRSNASLRLWGLVTGALGAGVIWSAF